MNKDEFYLQDTRTMVGNDMMWWAKDGKGYTSDLNKAHVFTEEAANRHHKMRSSDLPWRKSYIDSKARPAVDFQYVDHEVMLKDI